MNILNEPTQGLIVPTKTIARFQRKICTKISARTLAISYICFQVRIVKKKKKKEAILSTTTDNLVTPAPPTPDKGSIREIATGEITVSITPDDHLEGPYLLKTRELPGPGCRSGGGGGIYPPIFQVGGGVVCIITPLPNISRLNVILHRQNIWSTNKSNAALNSRFWMQKCANFPRSLCSLAYIHYLDVSVLPAVCEAFIVPCHYSRETAQM